jgi:hypothetical protein
MVTGFFFALFAVETLFSAASADVLSALWG